MGLFSTSQLDEINQIAAKSKELSQPTKTVNKKHMDAELREISQAVSEYFADSPAILIQTKEQLHDYITQAIASGYAGIDTETTGLDRIHDHIVGASLYYPGGIECYIPSQHLIPIFDTPYKGQLSYQELQEEFQRLADSDIKLIFANADFDLAMIYKDIKVDFIKNCYYDVILAWRCLKENEPNNQLKVLYNKYVLKGKGDPKRFSDFFSPIMFQYCKPEIAKLYAANDAKITYELFKWQLPYVTKDHPKCKKAHLEKIADLLWNVELPLISVCQIMHRTGIYLDKNTSNVLIGRYKARREAEMQKLADMVDIELEKSTTISALSKKPFTTGAKFNPNSPPHVKYLLYTVMNLPVGNNGGSTDKEVLKEINLPITSQILKVRSLGVLINTFVEKLPNATTPDSRIHARFNQIGADCIVGDSLIVTNTGYYTLQDLCESAGCIESTHVDVNDIQVINKDQVLESVQSVIKYTDYPTVKITTEMGFELEGTYNHPIMVSKYTAEDGVDLHDKRLATFWDERYFKQLSDIQVGDFVEIPCNYASMLSIDYQPLNLPLVSCCNTNAHKDVKMPDKCDELFAEFLGMYHADGAASSRDGTYTIALSNDDIDVIQRFAELASQLFNVPVAMYTKQHANHEVESYINCKQLSSIDSMLSHGKRNKQIPEIIYHSPVQVINSYIKGLTLDSSVYFDENGRAALELSVINKQDARFIQMHLASQGILCYMSSNENKGGWKTPRLAFNADNYILFRDTIGFIESCKYKDTEPCGKNKYKGRRIQDSFRVKVKSIEYRTNTVYDLHVPITHSFVSNGMISHNTGRLSSSEPNVMNIPSHAPDIRHMFRATPGYVMLSSDYSRQEPAITSYVSGDKHMLDSFINNKDIYASIASLAFNVPYERCLEFHPETHEYQPDGKARRDEAKTILLGISYGRAIPSIADQLYADRDDMSDEDKIKGAQKVYDSVLNAFPGLRQLMVASQNSVKKVGYTETILGRRRHLPDMQLPEFEFKPLSGYVNPDVDPLDPATLKNKDDIPERIRAGLLRELKGYKYFGQVAKRMRQLHDEEHIRVINNRPKIQDATRQVCNCVSLDTEILTTQGWKKYNEVSKGTEIFSYNLDTCKIERDIITHMNISQADTECVKFDSPTFDAVSTMNHRWVVGEADEKPRIKETWNIYKNKWPDYPILRVADNDFNDNPNYSDLDLKLIGWLLTDGTYHAKPYDMWLFQSTKHNKNADVYANMLSILNQLNLEYTDTVTDDTYYHSIYIRKCDYTVRLIDTFPDHLLTPEFISSLSARQAQIVMWSMIEADGTLGKHHTNITCACETAEQADLFQYLAFIAGYATNSYEELPEVHNAYSSSQTCYASVSNTSPIRISKPYYVVSVLRVQRAQIYPHHKELVTSHGVWCPTTKNSTWVARYKHKVFITGNSIIQGSAADMTKLAILNLSSDPEWLAVGGRMLTPIHDELLVEVPIQYWKEGGEVLSRCMLDAASFLPFKMTCDVTTTLRWYGLEYPCKYPRPESLNNISPDEIKWVQYHLYECEYLLPVYNDENGDKPKGDPAKGVNGVISDEYQAAIQDYKQKYNIESDTEFLDHIEHFVTYGNVHIDK